MPTPTPMERSRDLAMAGLRAALTVVRWSLGMMLLGATLSGVTAVLLLDEVAGWLRGGGWGWLGASVTVLALLILPWIWGWLGRAQGVRVAMAGLVGGHCGQAMLWVLRAIQTSLPTPNGTAMRPSPADVLAALRQPRKVSGPARWLLWLMRWKLDLDRTEAHLQAAIDDPRHQGEAPAAVLAHALAADLGERWLQPDASVLWALALAQGLLALTLNWAW